MANGVKRCVQHLAAPYLFRIVAGCAAKRGAKLFEGPVCFCAGLESGERQADFGPVGVFDADGSGEDLQGGLGRHGRKRSD